MAKDIYVELCDHLNKYPLWAPESNAFLEILRTMFTEAEARLALNLTPHTEPVSQIAQRLGEDPQILQKQLEEMVYKGLLMKKPGIAETEEQQYALLPTAPGLWEVTFAKKEKNPQKERLARLWRDYYTSGWGKEMHKRIKTPVMRVVPVKKSIPTTVEVLSYEEVSELLKTADFSAVLDCACRTAAELAGEGCGRSTDVCLMFGEFAQFLVETGRARQIDHAEALRILQKTEEEGLVHLTMNTSDAVLGICSCCTCCCTQLRAISYLSKPTAVATSRFMAQIDGDLCAGCETCLERCPVGAIEMADDIAGLLKDKCIGCGLCVTTCPVEAICLIERENYEKPVASIGELMESIHSTETP